MLAVMLYPARELLHDALFYSHVSVFTHSIKLLKGNANILHPVPFAM